MEGRLGWEQADQPPHPPPSWVPLQTLDPLLSNVRSRSRVWVQISVSSKHVWDLGTNTRHVTLHIAKYYPANFYTKACRWVSSTWTQPRNLHPAPGTEPQSLQCSPCAPSAHCSPHEGRAAFTPDNLAWFCLSLKFLPLESYSVVGRCTLKMTFGIWRKKKSFPQSSAYPMFLGIEIRCLERRSHRREAVSQGSDTLGAKPPFRIYSVVIIMTVICKLFY